MSQNSEKTLSDIQREAAQKPRIPMRAELAGGSDTANQQRMPMCMRNIPRVG